MISRWLSAAGGFAFSLAPAAAHAADEIAASWVQLGPGAVNEVRIVVTGEKCPMILVDGTQATMEVRDPPNSDFPIRLCVTSLPKTAKQASVRGRDLPLFTQTAKRIAVIGDTGCRIKGRAAQACNDPAKWPFPLVARAAAKLRPDLVIDVGDYYYREQPCPADNEGCAGTPSGDNWTTWTADFLAPAAPLLAAAPWVMVRGNHEDCDRGGRGWLRLLGPLSIAVSAACTNHIAPYAVSLGDPTLIVIDDSGAPDLYAEVPMVPVYAADLALLPKLAQGKTWLAMHRPIWGAVTGPLGITMGGNRTLIAALKNEHVLDSIDLMLSGHIHAFEALNYTGAPPQIVAGNGGDTLDNVPADLSHANLSGRAVKDGISLPGFGFLLMTREANGWTIDVYRLDGSRARQCHLAQRRIDCGKA